jgi:hypothetical protein
MQDTSSQSPVHFLRSYLREISIKEYGKLQQILNLLPEGCRWLNRKISPKVKGNLPQNLNPNPHCLGIQKAFFVKNVSKYWIFFKIKNA